MTAEVIVADNGSTDETSKVVREAPHSAMKIHHLLEGRPGKSHAFNAALAAAGGDVVLSTDDDVKVPQDWIEPLCRPILEGRAAVVQGGIAPATHLARPWLRNSFRAVSATVDTLPAPAIPPNCIGANLAFSRAVVEVVKGFDPMLGPGSPGGLCEDSLFGAMARAAGFRACYANAGSVEHHFDSSRLQPSNVLEVARRLGRSYALMDYHWRHHDTRGSRLRKAFFQAKLQTRLLFTAKDLDPIPEWHFWYERELAYQTQMTNLAGTERRYARQATTARVD
jgi:glycosyltransferase involved in cell wall biosynthesis